MAVTVAASWGAAQVVPASGSQPPRALSLPVTVANTAGDWMVAVIAWRQLDAGAGVSVTVEDDAHNWWEPLGAPSADSSASGVMRTAVWAAPAARAATTVMVAPTGAVTGIAATVLDVSGMTPWMSVTGIATAYANAATALSALSLSAPASQALVVTGCGSDVATGTITGPGAGWTSLAQQSATDGADHLGDVVLNCAWELSTGAPSASWSSSAAQDLSGVIAALLVTAAAPVQPNPDWPLVVTEIAPGAGASTPPSQLTWVDVSSRDLGFGVTQGAPYLLGGLQAGQGTLTLDNVDGALIPPGTGALAGIDSGTPARIRAVLPSQASPWYVFWSGTLQQLPASWDAMERGMCDATVTDAYAYTTRNVPPAERAEILAEPFLYAYWPLSEPAGALFAGNIAPGNQNPLAVTASKYGTSGVTQAFGQNVGALKGDPQSGMWSQSGIAVTATPYVNGYSLSCADGGFPAPSGGAAVEGWFQATTPMGTRTLPYALITLSGGKSPQAQIALAASGGGNTGGIILYWWNSAGTLQGPVAVTTGTDYSAGSLFHVALVFSATSWAVYVDGAQAASGSWGISRFTRVDVNGVTAPMTQTGYFWDGYAAHIAVYSGLLPASRVLAHYQAGSTAFAGESASWRMERLLGYAGTLGRRLILPETGVDVTPMASLSTLASSTTATATAGGYATASGTPAATALQYVASATPPGWLTVSPTGAIVYVPKQYAYDQTPKWLLGEDTAAGENPYQGDISFGYDPARVINDIQLTQPDTGVITVPSLGALEASSQAKYGDQNMQVNAYLENDPTSAYAAGPGLGDLANWLAATNAAPALRLGTVTVDAASHPASWPLVLGAAPGDLVTVYRRPPTSDVVLTVIGRISQVQRTLSFDPEGTVAGSVQLSIDAAPEHLTLTCDDSVRGQLSGSNVLGW